MSNSLPPQIEIFRAGRHTDDSGVVHNFSAADVAGMVASYDPTLREAPLTVGHPAHNRPAYGWVKGLAVNAAGNVVMDTHQVQPSFSEMVANKLFKKRSASFYPPLNPNNPKPGNWYLRHVAFLGAQPPAIAGLADFAEGDSTGTVNFSEDDSPVSIPPNQPDHPTQEHIRMTKELQDQLAAAQAKTAELEASSAQLKVQADTATAQLTQFAEAARKERTAAFTQFAEAQIKTGCLLPKEKDAAVAIMTTLAEAKEVSFAEGGATKTVAAVDWLKDLIARAKPAVAFGEFAPGNAGSAQGGQRTEAELDAAAHAHARTHKVSYAEALSAVATFTQ